MAITIPAVKQELRELKEQKDALERKIRGLEEYLGTHSGTNGSSVRGGADIRPAVREVFSANGNQPTQYKDIVNAVASKLPDVDRKVVEKKMVHVVRTILDNVSYGKYRLKEAAQSSASTP